MRVWAQHIFSECVWLHVVRLLYVAACVRVLFVCGYYLCTYPVTVCAWEWMCTVSLSVFLFACALKQTWEVLGCVQGAGGEAARPRGAVCFGLFAGDGLLECPYCAADHFTTLRVHEKKLFTGTWALAGITGSVLTGCHLLFWPLCRPADGSCLKEAWEEKCTDR